MTVGELKKELDKWPDDLLVKVRDFSGVWDIPREIDQWSCAADPTAVRIDA